MPVHCNTHIHRRESAKLPYKHNTLHPITFILYFHILFWL